MNTDRKRPDAHRLFLHEPGWRVALKLDSVREFCYAMAPGQDFYHRLLEGEVYLHTIEVRLCLACAERRGLLSYQPKGLRDPEPIVEFIEGEDDGGGVYRRELSEEEKNTGRG